MKKNLDAGETVNSVKGNQKQIAQQKTEDNSPGWFCFKVSRPSYLVKAFIENRVDNDGVLREKIIEVFAPAVTVAVRKNGKILEKIVEQPRGYIFIKLVPSQEVWALIFGTDGIRRYLGDRKPVPVPDEQISAYKESLDKEKVKAEQPFCSGDLVRIKQGVFKAMAGRVVGTSFDGKLKIELAIFSKIVPVEVNVKDVEKL